MSSTAPRPAACRRRSPSRRTAVIRQLDLDRANGCIRDKAHAYSQDGGLAVLFGNIAEKGCIVKTAGVDESILKFTGRARVCESQEEAVEKILADQIKAGDVVVMRYEGPKGGPGMQEMLYPTSYLKSKGLGKVCALLTDGRFSGGTSGLSHRPRLARGGGRRRHRPGRGGRHHRDRHPQPPHPPRRRKVGAGGTARGDGSEGRGGVEARQPRARGLGGAAGLRRDDHQRRHRRGARRAASLQTMSASRISTPAASGPSCPGTSSPPSGAASTRPPAGISTPSASRAPAQPADAEATGNFMHHVDELLRREHHHDYCAIVYADDIEKPCFVKIYDPNNLGVSCGFSDNPPLPGWIMCQVPPDDLKPPHPLPEGRKRWWSNLFN